MTKLITTGQEGLMPLSPDINGKVVVLRHTWLNMRMQLPRLQLVKATGGFGCKADSGGKVFGRFIASGEDTTFRRTDLIGEASNELIEQAMADTTPITPINASLREYLAIAKDGEQARGDTIEQAKERLHRITRSAVIAVYQIHPESFVTDLGFITYPEGIKPVEIQVRKGG